MENNITNATARKIRIRYRAVLQIGVCISTKLRQSSVWREERSGRGPRSDAWTRMSIDDVITVIGAEGREK